ncbi:hypothetical protein LCGC14_2064640, partial [marine sediment metagenome]
MSGSLRATRVWLLALAGAIFPAGMAAGDSVLLTSGLRYEPATVLNAEDGMLSFRVVSGRTVVKSLAQVAVIQLAGDEKFNRAETLARAGKLAEAVAAYNAAARGVGVGWKKALIGYRLVKAAETGGKIADAVSGWLAMMDVAFRHPIRLIANALGIAPASMIARGKELGVPVAALVGAREHAIRQAEAGVDIIVAQGTEAGGHCGEVTTLVLIPEVVRALREAG